ncbi:MAG: fibronectin type III domain-containing protein [Bacteroidales bacterium]|nr:fibronectin type III domain-containing protein [Bacteroidales bacterium]
MKKHLQILLLLAALLVPWATRAQDTVTIGDGTSTSYYGPFNSLWGYSFVEMIYPDSLIGTAGTITEVSFYLGQSSSATQTNDYDVFMKNVTRGSFAGNTDFETVDSSDIVFSGTWTIPMNYTGWVTLVLDTPFQYDGTSNLMIAMHEKTSGYSTRYFSCTSAPNSLFSAHSDSADPNPYDLASYTGNKYTQNIRPNVQLLIQPGGGTATTVTIGDTANTANYYYLPINTYFNYSLTQQLFTPEEIGGAGTITSISFNYAHTAAFASPGVQMYMKNVSKTVFASNTDMEPISASDLVWSDTLRADSAGWITINLDTPFQYDGISNLLVCCYDPTNGYPGSAYKFRTSSCSTYLALDYYSDSYVPDLTNVNSFSGSKGQRQYRNLIRLGIIPGAGPVCTRPTGLAATVTPGNGTIATLNWTADSTQTAWEVEYDTASDFSTAASVIVTDSTILNLTGLTAEATHYARVRAICGAGDTSDWSAVCDFTPSNAYSITINDGTATNGYVPVYGFYADAYLKAHYICPSTDLASMGTAALTQLTFYATQSSVNWGNANFNVYLAETTDSTISDFADVTDMTLVYSGSLGISDNMMVVPFTEEYIYMGGNLLVAVENTVEGSYVTSTWYGISAPGASVQNYSYSSLDAITPTQRDFLPKMTIEFIPTTVTCLPVRGLTASNVTSRGVTLTWTDTLNTGATYTVYDMSDTSVVATGITGTTYTVTGLTPETSYTFGVAANCSATDASRLRTVSATTLVACPMPTTLTVSDVTNHEVTLTWIDTINTGATYTVYDMSDTSVVATGITGTTYTVTGLTPETPYTFGVAANCSATDASRLLTVSATTLIACPAPTDLTMDSIYPTHARASWNDFANSYTLQYAPLPADSTGSVANPIWLSYDDSTYTNGIGNSSSQNWRWGVRYPSTMLTPGRLTKVSFFETASYSTSDYTISIYSGSATEPIMLLNSQTVTPTGSDGFHEITFTNPAMVDITQDLWIVIDAYGTYVMSACSSSEPNNQWIYNGGVWMHLGDAASSLAGNGWMIRGEITPLNLDSLTWTTVLNATSPASLTGLTPETGYITRVKGDCGAVDGESAWTMTSFTTPSPCAAPNSLTNPYVLSNRATLDWIGYQESYNVRYWQPARISNFDTANFTQIGGDSTAHDTLTQYTVSLSGFTGTGNVAFRHYHVTDMFRLNIDDIVLTNANGDTIVNEDFESGVMPANWVIADQDGDGQNWYIQSTSQDGNGHDVGNGSYCATSASYNNDVLYPDNWMIIPNVALGGTLTFVARGQDPGWAAEVFGVFVSTTPLLIPASDTTVVNNVTNPYQLTGLDSLTTYAWEVQGVNSICDGGVTAWSTSLRFTTDSVNLQAFANDTVTACNSYIWRGTNYIASTTVADTVYAPNADSIYTLVLTVNYSNTGIETVTACDSYTWHGTNYTASTNTPTYTSTNIAGCDSVTTLHLTINNSNTATETVTACDSYTWHGTNYTASTNTPTYTSTNIVGCDSVTTLHLTINYSNTAIETVTACNSYVWHGTNYTASTNTPTFTTTNAAGCDSVTTLHLTIIECSTTEITACDSYTWHGNTYTVGGTYTDGTDTLVLTINHSNTGIETVTACNSYTWHGTAYTASTSTPTDTSMNAVGCDSVTTLHLTINYSTTGDTFAIACDSFAWYGTNYISSANPTRTTTNAVGCDSVTTLHLTINNSNTGIETVTACNSYVWHGTTYNASTNTPTYTSTNAAGCDSVTTLHLTIIQCSTTDITACDSYTWFGTTYTVGGTYYHGTDTLNLTLNYSTTGTETVTACDSYTWHGTAYTASTNTPTDTTTNAAGCDSVTTLHLTINYSTTYNDGQADCDSLQWNDVWYTTSTVIIDSLQTIAGCDSIVTITLTVNHSVEIVDSVIALESYTWHDSVYTESGTYYFHTQTVAGCDSTEVLVLTIGNYYSVAIVVANTEGLLNVGGTVTGAGSYLAGTEVTLTATPDSGYLFDGWYTRSAMGFGGELITADSVYTFTLEENVVVVAMFERIGANSALLTVQVDSTLGQVLFNGQQMPFNVYRGTLGDEVTLTAVAVNNSTFLGWVNAQGDTLSRLEYFTITLEQTTMALTAAFRANVGIDAVDASNVTIIARENGVVVRGAAEAEVYVFDVVGRMVGHVSAASDEQFIRLPQTGVYLVKVADLPARRVVVRQ